MDINALASEFGSAGVTPDTGNSGVDINGLAAEFGSKKKADEIKDAPRVDVYRAAPPISGATKEQSDAINAESATRPNSSGANPRDTALAEGIKNYPSSVGNAIADQFSSGLGDIKSGLSEAFNENKPASGVGKAAVGALEAATSPAAGVAKAVSLPVTELTGNPDIGDRAGFVASSALPIVPGAKAISNAKPSNVALKDLTDMITNNGANPENLVPVVQGMRSNPRLGPADLNPAVLSATQKLFTTEGDAAKNYLRSTSTSRMAASKDVQREAYDTSTGLPVNAVQKLKDLSDAAKKVGSEKINPAISGAKPVDISPVVEHIDSILKPGVMSKVTGESTLPFSETKQILNNVKKMIASESERLTDPKQLHDFQSALRKEAEARMGSADGKQRQLGYALMQVRNKVVDAIDAASPQVDGKGTYKPALSNYRDEKHIAEAFNDAYTGVFSNSKKLENRPEFTKEWIDGLSPHELEAARQGARLAIDTQIGVANNPTLAGQNAVKSDFNKQKLEMLFGKKEATDLLQKLEHERLISNTHNKVFENSQTAMRIAAEKKVDLPEKTTLQNIVPYAAEGLGAMTTGYPAIGTMAYQGLKGANAVKDAIKMKLAKEKNLQLAKMALPTEGPSRDELIKSLQAAIPGPKQSLLTRGAGALSRLVSP